MSIQLVIDMNLSVEWVNELASHGWSAVHWSTEGEKPMNQTEKGLAMNVIEQTIEATLDANGQLCLTRQPRLPPGPLQVTIRVATGVGPRRGLADVIREIAAEQRSRGFPGRSPAELRAEEEARLDEDMERERELDAARRTASPGGSK